jgi:hypothetical protein
MKNPDELDIAHAISHSIQLMPMSLLERKINYEREIDRERNR